NVDFRSRFRHERGPNQCCQLTLVQPTGTSPKAALRQFAAPPAIRIAGTQAFDDSALPKEQRLLRAKDQKILETRTAEGFIERVGHRGGPRVRKMHDAQFAAEQPLHLANGAPAR